MTTATGHTKAIRAGKAIGTNVYDRSGKSIGEVKDIVLDKTSNSILFAVVSFGGFLGIGEKFHPIPWAELDYDPSQKATSFRSDGATEVRALGFYRRAHSERRPRLSRSRVQALRHRALLALKSEHRLAAAR